MHLFYHSSKPRRLELTGGANGHSAVRTTSLATLKGSFFFFFTSDFEELVVASVGSWRSCVGGKRGLLFVLHVFCPSRPNAAPHWLKGQRPQQCVKTRSKDKSQGLDPQPSATKTETCPVTNAAAAFEVTTQKALLCRLELFDQYDFFLLTFSLVFFPFFSFQES